jgi:hypothetical protein
MRLVVDVHVDAHLKCHFSPAMGRYLCGTGPALIVDSQLGEPAQQSAIKGRQHSEEGYAIWHIRTQPYCLSFIAPRREGGMRTDEDP